jgi:hypothetical protein
MDGREYFEQQILVSLAGPVAARIYDEKNPKQEGNCLQVCFHEAGHCGMFVHQGKQVFCIEVDLNGGRVWTFPPADLIRQQPIVTDEQTIAEASNLISTFHPDPFSLAALEAETRRILLNNWHTIERIARALYCRCETWKPGWRAVLSGGEIRLICEFSIKPKGENDAFQKTGSSRKTDRDSKVRSKEARCFAAQVRSHSPGMDKASRGNRKIVRVK